MIYIISALIAAIGILLALAIRAVILTVRERGFAWRRLYPRSWRWR